MVTLFGSSALRSMSCLGSGVTLTMLKEAGGISNISFSSGKQLIALTLTPI
jgi:hypothetical protein